MNFFPPNRGVDFYFEFLPAKSQIEESISILNFFPPNRGRIQLSINTTTSWLADGDDRWPTADADESGSAPKGNKARRKKRSPASLPSSSVSPSASVLLDVEIDEPMESGNGKRSDKNKKKVAAVVKSKSGRGVEEETGNLIYVSPSRVSALLTCFHDIYLSFDIYSPLCNIHMILVQCSHAPRSWLVAGCRCGSNIRGYGHNSPDADVVC